MREFNHALCQTRSGRRKKELWAALLLALARDLVPERPGRREPRAVKRRPKYDLLNRPRARYRDRPRRIYITPYLSAIPPTGLKFYFGCDSTKMPRRWRWERVVSALCANSFEPQARRYNRTPHWQRTLFLNSVWEGRLGGK